MNSTAAIPPGRPTIEHLLLLRRLRRQLLRSQSAQLLYLWGDDSRSLAWLQGELDRTLRARSRRLLSLPALANGQPDVEPPAPVDTEIGIGVRRRFVQPDHEIVIGLDLLVALQRATETA